MDIDQSLEDIISSRKGPAAPAPGSDRPSSRNNRPQSGPGGGGISRRGRGGGRPSERSGRSERENGIRLPYSRDRPPTRSSEDSWTHDMYNPRGASNDDDMRGGGAGAVRSGNPTYQRAPRGGGGGGNDDNTRLVVSNVHYEVTKEDLEVSAPFTPIDFGFSASKSKVTILILNPSHVLTFLFWRPIEHLLKDWKNCNRTYYPGENLISTFCTNPSTLSFPQMTMFLHCWRPHKELSRQEG